MPRNRILALASALSTAMALACGADADGLPDYHACQVTYSAGWDNKLLELQHQEPRTCPVPITAPGDLVTTGGDVYDYGYWDVYRLHLIVYDGIWNPVIERTDDFQKPAGANYELASVYYQYPAATSTGYYASAPDNDRAQYLTEAFDNSNPNATMTINYQYFRSVDKSPTGGEHF